MLGHAPVNRRIASGHGASVVENLRNKGVECKALRRNRDRLAHGLENVDGDAGRRIIGPGLSFKRRPVDRMAVLDMGKRHRQGRQSLAQTRTGVREHLFRCIGREHALRDQLIGI